LSRRTSGKIENPGGELPRIILSGLSFPQKIRQAFQAIMVVIIIISGEGESILTHTVVTGKETEDALVP
jgi:hypothetical protein